MAPNFHAGHIYVEDMGDFLLIGFADRQFGTQDYLMLQRAHHFDSQDSHIGMAEVYVERNDQAWSGYGGMERFKLLPDRVRVLFDDQGAQTMAGTRQMAISFEASREMFDALRAGLRQCFDGFSYYVDRVA